MAHVEPNETRVEETERADDGSAEPGTAGPPEGQPRPIPNPKHGDGEPVPFAHPAEEAFARVLDFYQIHWEREPTTFPLEWDEEGRVISAFSPDFYLVSEDLYIELTTMKQSLVTGKNRKLRLLHELYPGVRCKLMYRRDVMNLAVKYGLFGEAAVPFEEVEEEPLEDEEIENDGSELDE